MRVVDLSLDPLAFDSMDTVSQAVHMRPTERVVSQPWCRPNGERGR